VYRVEFARPAAKKLASLPVVARVRLIKRIESLADNPRPRGVETLIGGHGALRVRVGTYRVIYEIRDAVLVVLVLKIGHRRDVYR
jgi:mRNA interferase RelE/StbE